MSSSTDLQLCLCNSYDLCVIWLYHGKILLPVGLIYSSFNTLLDFCVLQLFLLKGLVGHFLLVLTNPPYFDQTMLALQNWSGARAKSSSEEKKSSSAERRPAMFPERLFYISQTQIHEYKRKKLCKCDTECTKNPISHSIKGYFVPATASVVKVSAQSRRSVLAAVSALSVVCSPVCYDWS